ncbi:hypothetical protein LCGC14_1019780 [marine sediment metagenome]|uniref:Uncharacterized protein n=1 Tax=marine sediment metagenome TaxID=412755 RepID=A0A0F9NJD0_9ZZZZ
MSDRWLIKCPKCNVVQSDPEIKKGREWTAFESHIVSQMWCPVCNETVEPENVGTINH